MRYIQKNILLYETILSKGKGKPTKKLEAMFLKLSKGVFAKRRVEAWDADLQKDVYQHGFMVLWTKWQSVNEKKFDDRIFNYYTEVLKRGFADGYNVSVLRKKHGKDPDLFIVKSWEAILEQKKDR